MMALDDPEEAMTIPPQPSFGQHPAGVHATSSRGATPNSMMRQPPFGPMTPRMVGTPGLGRDPRMPHGPSSILADWHARRSQQSLMLQQPHAGALPPTYRPAVPIGSTNVSATGSRSTADLIAETQARRMQQQQSMLASSQSMMGGGMMPPMYRPTVPVGTTNISSTGSRTTAELIAERAAMSAQQQPPADARVPIGSTNVSSTGSRTTAELIAEAQARKAAGGNGLNQI